MASGIKVAIIGAGVSGLAAIKSCLEEGLDPVCFEQHDTFGGIWNFTEYIRPNQGAASYQTLVTNTSKEFTCFSDFPFGAYEPTYPNKHQFCAYLNRYADEFNLKRCIRYNVRVKHIEKTEDHVVTGNWLISYVKDDDLKHDVFNCVMVCSGRYKKPILPDIPGLNKFTGDLHHAVEFRVANQPRYKNKNILVVGNSHTAGDIADACSDFAKKVFLAVGRGTSVLTRFSDGKPVDLSVRRFLLTFTPNFFKEMFMRRLINKNIDHKNYGLYCDAPVLAGPLMLNDRLPKLIKSEKVLVKRRTEAVTQSGAKFDDGSEENFDVIVMATGYDVEFDFLDNSLIKDEDECMKLYNLVWPIGTTGHPTLSMIGAHVNRGPAVLSLELEARWAAAVFAGAVKLPPAPVMEDEFRKRKENIRRIYGCDKTIPDMSVVEFNDMLADKIGARPSFWKLIFRQPWVAFQIFFGTAFNVQYRIFGRHVWDGAINACKNAYWNTMQGIQ